MPLPSIDNFKIESELPIEDRIIATSSSERNAIEYKYDGLKVFQLDDRSTYIWNKSKYLSTGITSSSWDINESGIGGSGLVNRIPKWDYTNKGLTNTSIVSSPINYNELNEKIGIGGIPYEAFQINGNYLTSALGTSSMPFVVHKGVSTIIGENWYWDIGLLSDQAFDGNFGSSTISFKNGGFEFKGRVPGSSYYMNTLLVLNNNGSANFSNYISISGTNSVPNDNGSIYYNTDVNRFKVKENSEWRTISNMYETYSCILNQTSTSSPTDTILESTVGSGTWSYVGIGIYRLTITNGFVGNVPSISGFCGPYTSSSVFFGEKINDSSYQIRTLISSGGTHSNGLLSNKLIEIKIWR